LLLPYDFEASFKAVFLLGGGGTPVIAGFLAEELEVGGALPLLYDGAGITEAEVEVEVEGDVEVQVKEEVEDGTACESAKARISGAGVSRAATYSCGITTSY